MKKEICFYHCIGKYCVFVSGYRIEKIFNSTQYAKIYGFLHGIKFYDKKR